MSSQMNEENKRWSAKRKSVLVLEIIQGKTTVAEASRQFDLTPSELESWVAQAKASMENALRAKPQDVRQQYEKQINQLQTAYGDNVDARHGDGFAFKFFVNAGHDAQHGRLT